MNQLMNVNDKMMSSKEISELTEKSHSHVMRDIRNMLDQLGSTEGTKIGFLERINNLGLTVKDEYYLLNHDLTMLLLTGYDVKARLKVIQRWKELEQQVLQPSLPNFMDPAEAAVAWAEQYKAAQLAITQVAEQQALIEQQKPSVEFVENYVDSSGLIGIREAGKVLNIAQNKFVEQLLAKKVLFRAGQYLLPYATFEKKGYLVVKTSTNNLYVTKRTLFTPSGMLWVSGLLNN